MALTMLDVLPEDPVLGVVFKHDEAALLGAAHLRGESGKNTPGVSSHSQRFPIFPGDRPCLSALREVGFAV